MWVMTSHVATHRAPRRFEAPNVQRFGKIVSAVLLAVVVALGIALIAVPKATGSVPLTVLTGSMSPTYDPGSVVIVRPVDVDDLQIGDVITFQEKSGDPTVVTHRIVGIGFGGDGGGRTFTTQGDANGAADAAPVTEPQVRGKVWYSVPLVGYAVNAFDADLRATLVKVLAGALLLYGGYLIAAGVRDHRRRRAARAVETSEHADAAEPQPEAAEA